MGEEIVPYKQPLSIEQIQQEKYEKEMQAYFAPYKEQQAKKVGVTIPKGKYQGWESFNQGVDLRGKDLNQFSKEQRKFFKLQEIIYGDREATDEEMVEFAGAIAPESWTKAIAPLGGWMGIYGGVRIASHAYDAASIAASILGTPASGGFMQLAKQVGKKKAYKIISAQIKREMKKKSGRIISDKAVSILFKRQFRGKALSKTGQTLLGPLGKLSKSPKRLNRIAAEAMFSMGASTSLHGLKAIKTGNSHLEELGINFAYDVGLSGVVGFGAGSKALKRLGRMRKTKRMGTARAAIEKNKAALLNPSIFLHSGYSGQFAKKTWDTLWRPLEWATNKALNTPIIPKVMREVLGAPSGKLKSVLFTGEERLAKRLGIPMMAAKMLRDRTKRVGLSRQLVEKLIPIIDTFEAPSHKVWLDLMKRGKHSLDDIIDEMSTTALDRIKDFEKQGTKGYWSLPPQERQKIKKAFDLVEDWKAMGTESGDLELRRIHKMTESLQNAFLGTKSTKGEILSKDGILPTEEFSKIMQKLKSLKNVKAKGKELKRLLKNIHENPAYSDSIRDLARDLQSTTGYTVDAFPRMALGVEEAVLMEKIGKLPGMVSESRIPGHVRVEEGRFKGLWIDEDLNDALVGLKHVQGDKLQIYNRLFLSPWKLGKVVLRVPGQMRNAISNVIQNDWGGLPFWRQDVYWKAIQEIRKGNKSAIMKDFKKATGVATTFAEVETQYLPAALKWNASTLDLVEYYASHEIKPVKDMIKMYQMVETVSKVAKFIHNRTEKNMLTYEAAEDAIKWTFNYGEVTPAVKLARGTVAPFATWSAKIFPLFFETAKNHPWRLSKWALTPSIITHQAMKHLEITEDEWEGIKKTMPEWQKAGWHFMLPWRDEKQRLQMLNLTWLIPGLGDMSDFSAEGTFGGGMLMGNPLISIASDWAKNESFSGAPIWNEWDTPSVKFMKWSWHLNKQLSPSFMGDFWSRAYKTAIDKPGAQTWGQHAAGMFGTKVLPIDRAYNDQMFYKNKQREQREILSKMRKTPFNELPDKYADWLTNYYIERLQGLHEGESRIQSKLQSPMSPLPGLAAGPLGRFFKD